MDFITLATQFTETSLQGRYITLKHIEPILKRPLYASGLTVIGRSVNNQPIYKYVFGTGKTKILMWSQMHGNESTTTKALFDLFNFLQSDVALAVQFRNECTICFLPMLNPDGAAAYTRENANNVDLNRDAQQLSQPESKVLRSVYNDFSPDYCFNLHDQRSIYGVGSSGKSAVVSFLAPSFNDNRDVNATRLRAMHIISFIYDALSKIVPDHCARFDDSFNLNCVGDTFQFLGTPTVLFEAGHYFDDYQRDYTRKLIFVSYLSALHYLSENDVVVNDIENYLSIPQNKVNFYDLFYINVSVIAQGIKKMFNFAIQYDELLVNQTLQFRGRIAAVSTVDLHFAHQVIDCKSKIYKCAYRSFPEIGDLAHFSIDGKNIFVDGLKVI